MSAVYNFGKIVEGTSLEERVFGIKRFENEQLQDLTEAKVYFEVFRSKTSKLYVQKDNQAVGGVEIVDPTACVIKILKITDLTLTPAKYYWHLKIVWADGTILKPLGGEFDIVTIKELVDG